MVAYDYLLVELNFGTAFLCDLNHFIHALTRLFLCIWIVCVIYVIELWCWCSLSVVVHYLIIKCNIPRKLIPCVQITILSAVYVYVRIHCMKMKNFPRVG